MFVHHVGAVPVEAERELQIPWIWSQKQFVSCLAWLLGPNSDFMKEKQSALNCWAISAGLAFTFVCCMIFFFVCFSRQGLSLKLRDLPAPTSRVLGFKVCATTH